MRFEEQFPEKDGIIRKGLICALYNFADAVKTGLRDGCFDFDFCMGKAEVGMVEYYPRNLDGWGTTDFSNTREEWKRIWEREKEDFAVVARQYVQDRKTACMIHQIQGATAVPLLNGALDKLGMPYRVFPMQRGVKIFIEAGTTGEHIVLFMKHSDIASRNLSKLQKYVLSLKEMTGLFQIPICVRKLTAKERTAFNNALIR